MPDTGWISFDCFGTLVDWRTGFEHQLRPHAGERLAALIDAYHHFERQQERLQPHRAYREILARSLVLAMDSIGRMPYTYPHDLLSEGWGALPVFGDVERELAALRGAGHRLAVLTNCDEDLFALTHRAFAMPFDLVVTAERVQAYKPAQAHFAEFQRRTGVTARRWVHVACSAYHDIVPARELGIARVWIDRDRTGEDPAIASVRLESAVGLADTVAHLWETEGATA